MIQRRIAAVLFAFALALPAVLPAAAQTPSASDFPPSADQLAGIQAAVYREYAPAGMCVSGEEGCSSFGAGATPMTQDDIVNGQVGHITVSVYQLDTADNAAIAYERIGTGLLGSFANMNQGGDGTEDITSEDPGGIGDQATLSRLVVTSSGGPVTNETTMQYLTFQQDKYVVVVGMQGNRGPSEEPLPELDDPTGPIMALATEISANGPSADDVAFADDGTSTGGPWGFMPAADDPLLMGLVPVGDYVTFPVPEQ